MGAAMYLVSAIVVDLGGGSSAVELDEAQW